MLHPCYNNFQREGPLSLVWGRVLFHIPEPPERCAAVTSKYVMGGASKNFKSFLKRFEKKCLKHRILINLDPLIYRYNYKVFRQRTLLVFKESLDRREELMFNLAALELR